MDVVSVCIAAGSLALTAANFVYGLQRNARQDTANAAAHSKQSAAIEAEAAHRASQLSQLRDEAARREQEVALLQTESERRNEELALLREQVDVLRDQRAETSRKQAEQVKVEWASSSVPPPGIRLDQGDEVHAAFVENASSQPIREVRAGLRMSNASGERYHGASANAINTRRTGSLTAGEQEVIQSYRADVVRAGDEQIFLFSFSARMHPGAQMAVRFIDRAGIAWQIDPDFTLKPLAANEWEN
jgi:hypothetical protein